MVFYVLLALIAVSAIICFFNAARVKRPPKPECWQGAQDVDVLGAARRLSGAITFQTVSYTDTTKMDFHEFLNFHCYLKEQYPLVHNNLTLEKVGDYSLLFRWKGSDPGLLPIGLMAHQDVVPVEREHWTREPFAGTIADGYVYGRGTLDMKGHLLAIMESVEYLIQNGYTPQRDVYLIFGHNEEVGASSGDNGAESIAKLLESRNIRMEMVIDEGGAIISGKGFGIDQRISVIGVTEKGGVNIKLTARHAGGHSSTPSKHSALGLVCAAAKSVEVHPCRASIHPVIADMFIHLAPYANSAMRLVMTNRWLFDPVIKLFLLRSSQTAALLRTTIALTMAQGSSAANVLPQEASVTVNMRILPGETRKDAADHIKKWVGKGIEVEYAGGRDPSPVSPTDCAEYRMLVHTIDEIFDNVAITPYMVMGGTDSRFTYPICDHVYRIAPFTSMFGDMGGIHGSDERIEIASLGQGIRFFIRLIQNTTGMQS